MLDIVISTLNEEHFIGGLLASLEKQTYKDFTVYVSDGNSDDKTIEIAQKFSKSLRLKILKDAKRNLAHQRNIGGNAGTSEEILFLDADVILPPVFLAKLMKQVSGKDLINCWISPLSKKKVDKIMMLLYNLLALEVVRYFWPIGMGGCLYTKRAIFEKLKGFDNKLVFWEDVDFIKRAVDSGAKFTIVRTPKVLLSTRRFEVEGRIKYIVQMLKGVSFSIRTGKIPGKDQISYPMDLHYSDLLKRKKQSQKKLKNLIITYTAYIAIVKKIKTVSLDTMNVSALVQQILSLPLLKVQKVRIQKILGIQKSKKSG